MFASQRLFFHLGVCFFSSQQRNENFALLSCIQRTILCFILLHVVAWCHLLWFLFCSAGQTWIAERFFLSYLLGSSDDDTKRRESRMILNRKDEAKSAMVFIRSHFRQCWQRSVWILKKERFYLKLKGVTGNLKFFCGYVQSISNVRG